MADTGAAMTGRSQGRIRREDADQVVMACLVGIVTSIFEGSDRDQALYLLERAVPLASRSSRMEVFRPLALDLLAAAPARRKRDGAAAWMRVFAAVQMALSRDAIQRAFAMVEV